MSGSAPISDYDAWRLDSPEPIPDEARELEQALDALRACDFAVDWSLFDFDGTLPKIVKARLDEELIATDTNQSPAEQVAEYLLDVLSRLVQQDGVEFAPEIVEQISELHRLACLASA